MTRLASENGPVLPASILDRINRGYRVWSRKDVKDCVSIVREFYSKFCRQVYYGSRFYVQLAAVRIQQENCPRSFIWATNKFCRKSKRKTNRLRRGLWEQLLTKSITEVCVQIYGNLVEWTSSKQDKVAKSTCEAELRALDAGADNLHPRVSARNDRRIQYVITSVLRQSKRASNERRFQQNNTLPPSWDDERRRLWITELWVWLPNCRLYIVERIRLMWLSKKSLKWRFKHKKVWKLLSFID